MLGCISAASRREEPLRHVELVELHRFHQDVTKKLVFSTYTASTAPIFQLVMKFIEGELLILVHKKLESLA